MRKKHFAICLGIVVAIVLLTVLVPSCAVTIGTIEVKATLHGDPWEGQVNYTLTSESGTHINGTEVPYTFSVDTGEWTCAWDFGHPPGDIGFVDITPSATQTLESHGTIIFTLNFEYRMV